MHPMAWFKPKRDPLREDFEAEALPHMDALFANALRLTHARADAEDLVQETVLRAFRFYDRFERRPERQGLAAAHPVQHVRQPLPALDQGARDQRPHGPRAERAKTWSPAMRSAR